jgi:hypothetical protein
MHGDTSRFYIVPLVIITLSIVGIVAILHYSTRPANLPSPTAETATTSTTSVDTATSTDSYDAEQVKELAAISKYCVDYYTSSGTENVPSSDFTTARPLSYYTCGDFSNIQTMTLSNGMHLYFVAINTSLDCGSGGCGYIPLLEVAPGSVKRLRGFNTYTDDGSMPIKPDFSADTDGSVFGFLTFEAKNNLVVVYVHQSSSCGMENIYQILNSTPTLTGAYDTCPAAKPTVLYVNPHLPSTLTKYIDVGTFSE